MHALGAGVGGCLVKSSPRYFAIFCDTSRYYSILCDPLRAQVESAETQATYSSTGRFFLRAAPWLRGLFQRYATLSQPVTQPIPQPLSQPLAWELRLLQLRLRQRCRASSARSGALTASWRRCIRGGHQVAPDHNGVSRVSDILRYLVIFVDHV